MIVPDPEQTLENKQNAQKIRELEKQVRILSKKLERSENDRRQLEQASEEREIVLKSVIKELERSQFDLELRSRELETALANLQNLQVQLIESEKMSALGVMVGGIAHEINNPVSFIYGNLSHAQDYLENLFTLIQLFQSYFPQLPDEIKTYIKTIDLEFIKQDYPQLFTSMNLGAERICEIVQSLKSFSRLDEADLKKQVDIHSDINHTLTILNHRLQSYSSLTQGIKIIKDFADIPLVECYSRQLNQVFINILTNAIDALEEAEEKFTNSQLQLHQTNPISTILPTININTQNLNNQWVAIEIADNGIGIPPEIHSKLFDPFFTTKPVGKGTGLGLSICYQIIVQQHHGSLDCQSVPGEGTKFTIKIPIYQD